MYLTCSRSSRLRRTLNLRTRQNKDVFIVVFFVIVIINPNRLFNVRIGADFWDVEGGAVVRKQSQTITHN